MRGKYDMKRYDDSKNSYYRWGILYDPTVRRFKIHITDDCKIYDDKI